MKKTPDFTSILKEDLADYVRFMVGNGRSFRVETTILKEFDRFLQTRQEQLVDADCINDFTYTKPGLSDCQYEKRHRIIRAFQDYRAIRGRGESVPTPPKARGSGRKIPYHYTEEDIAALLKCAGELKPTGSLRPHTFQTIIGLLYCTGLRVSEAMNLDVGDVDLDSGVLYIRNTKFKKSRYVPVHSTTVTVLKQYKILRDQHYSKPKCEAFFLNNRADRVNYSTFESPFIHMVRKLGLGTKGHNSRIHDLRHTFAVNRLLAWYKEGADFHSLLPTLSTYMGHAHFEDTTYYLNASADIMAMGAVAFQRGGGANA